MTWIRVSLAAAVAIALSGCPSEPLPSDGDLPHDAAVHDAISPADFAAPDLGPNGFCQGSQARLARSGSSVVAAAVTSSELVLNCCEGVMLRVHPADGSDFVGVAIRRFGGSLPTGDIDLAHLPSDLPVALTEGANWPPGDALPLSGTMHIERPQGSKSPLVVSACITVGTPATDAGATAQELAGARVYIPPSPIARWDWDSRFTLRLLADRQITAQQALKVPLANLVLASDSVVSLMKIAWYGAATNSVRWDNLATSAALKNMVGQVGTQGVPFVVEADGARIYLGAFYSLVSSQGFAAPVIVMEHISDEGFTIEAGYPAPSPGQDPRGDARILKVLQETGKLGP